jgi:hypothetical protein
MSGLLNQGSLSFSEMTWVNQKVTEIKQHAAWNEKVDELGSERLLTGEVPLTFLLRPGKDTYHYFLSYVEMDGTIHHKLVKIELSVRGWLYRNGNGNIRENINDLIPTALHCAPEECKPYRTNRPLFSLA